MFTFLTKYQKALECFQNGQELITNKTQESILRRAVLKQNIGAVRNMNGRSKEDFELAIECHLDAIKTFGEYARSRQESDTTETKQPRSGKLVNTCAGNGERLLYTVQIENKGRWVIHEALKEDQAASAGAARSFLNLGHAHFKLGDIMCAQQRFSQADIYAKEAQDTRTRIHAHESLARIAMQLSYSRAARKYLLTALTLAISSEGWEDDDGQHDSSDVQRITDKLSKIHVTMSADREHFNRTDSHWPILRSSPRRKLCATTLQASSKHHAHKVEEDSDN
ncbi:uncharacterized protein [Haliotis asinina]|uniref:uncharacterized protein n=1 Tax=Haliotis asinina TaxID=109174 RepID=UPI003531FBF2